MIENICSIREIFALAIIPCMIISFVLFLIFRNSKSKIIPNLSIFILLVIGLTVFLLNLTIEKKIREEIKLKLNNKEIQKILINNEVPNFELNHLKEELLAIKKLNTKRGTSKTKKFVVDIITEESKYSFNLFRNSFEQTKYHLRTSKYDYELDIGMIETNFLNGIK